MNEIATAIRALRDAFRHAKLPYDASGYFNIALPPDYTVALQAEPDYADFADQKETFYYYYEGFRIWNLN